MRRLFLAATAVLLFAPAPVNAMSHREYVALKHCDRGVVKSCIHRAAIHRHIDYGTMLYIAHRESRFNPRAQNTQAVCHGGYCEHAQGLFQFLPSTFATTPYPSWTIWSAKWNALAAGWYMQRYGMGAWACC